MRVQGLSSRDFGLGFKVTLNPKPETLNPKPVWGLRLLGLRDKGFSFREDTALLLEFWAQNSDAFGARIRGFVAVGVPGPKQGSQEELQLKKA